MIVDDVCVCRRNCFRMSSSKDTPAQTHSRTSHSSTIHPYQSQCYTHAYNQQNDERDRAIVVEPICMNAVWAELIWESTYMLWIFYWTVVRRFAKTTTEITGVLFFSEQELPRGGEGRIWGRTERISICEQLRWDNRKAFDVPFICRCGFLSHSEPSFSLTLPTRAKNLL